MVFKEQVDAPFGIGAHDIASYIKNNTNAYFLFMSVDELLLTAIDEPCRIGEGWGVGRVDVVFRGLKGIKDHADLA